MDIKVEAHFCEEVGLDVVEQKKTSKNSEFLDV